MSNQQQQQQPSRGRGRGYNRGRPNAPPGSQSPPSVSDPVGEVCRICESILIKSSKISAKINSGCTEYKLARATA